MGAVQGLLPEDMQWWWYDLNIKTTCLFAAIWVFSLIPYKDYIQKAISYIFLIDRSKEFLDQLINDDKGGYTSLYLQTSAMLCIIFILIFKYGKTYAVGNIDG